jgi:hypothetical protein
VIRISDNQLTALPTPDWAQQIVPPAPLLASARTNDQTFWAFGAPRVFIEVACFFAHGCRRRRRHRQEHDLARSAPAQDRNRPSVSLSLSLSSFSLTHVQKTRRRKQKNARTTVSQVASPTAELALRRNRISGSLPAWLVAAPLLNLDLGLVRERGHSAQREGER